MRGRKTILQKLSEKMIVEIEKPASRVGYIIVYDFKGVRIPVGFVRNVRRLQRNYKIVKLQRSTYYTEDRRAAILLALLTKYYGGSVRIFYVTSEIKF